MEDVEYLLNFVNLVALLDLPGRARMERMLVLAGLPALRFLGRANGWFSPDDARVPLLPEPVRGGADARNLAVCARTPAALARVLPGVPLA